MVKLETKKRMSNRSWSLCAMVLATLTGCISTRSHQIVQNGALEKSKLYYVMHFAQDQRALHQAIADQLTIMGYKARYGEEDAIPKDADLLVTYQDQWHWDMSNYMIRLKLQVRKATDKSLVATGENFRTSLVRRSPAVMINETLQEVFGGDKKYGVKPWGRPITTGNG